MGNQLDSMKATRGGRKPRFPILPGRRHGHLVAIDVVGARVLVRCDCGVEFVTHGSRLIWDGPHAANARTRCSRACPIPTAPQLRKVHWKLRSSELSRCGAGTSHGNGTFAQDEVTCSECLRIGDALPAELAAKAILAQVRSNNRKRNMGPVALTLQDIIDIRIGKPCSYCHAALPPTTPCLDRVDNARGYHRDNVIPCCSMCNDARGHLIESEEFMMIMKLRLERTGGKPWDGQRWRSALRSQDAETIDVTE